MSTKIGKSGTMTNAFTIRTTLFGSVTRCTIICQRYKSDSQLNDILSRIPKNRRVLCKNITFRLYLRRSIVLSDFLANFHFSRIFVLDIRNSLELWKIIRRSKLTIPRRRIFDSRNKRWHVSKDKLTNCQIDKCHVEWANKWELCLFVLGYFLISILRFKLDFIDEENSWFIFNK